jgi:hypothetical protein
MTEFLRIFFFGFAITLGVEVALALCFAITAVLKGDSGK